jgi:hypothetical protein
LPVHEHVGDQAVVDIATARDDAHVREWGRSELLRADA